MALEEEKITITDTEEQKHIKIYWYWKWSETNKRDSSDADNSIGYIKCIDATKWLRYDEDDNTDDFVLRTTKKNEECDSSIILLTLKEIHVLVAKELRDA